MAMDFQNDTNEPYLLKVVLLILEFLFVLLKAAFYFVEAIFRCFVPLPRKSVRDDIVLITGAGQGLGKELALRFAALGATVVLWDVNQECNEQVAQEIKKKGGKAFAYRCDVTDDNNIERVALQVRREVGDVTMLINNAGILNSLPLLCLNTHQIRKTMAVNTLAHFWTIRQFLPRMLEIGRGHIVAIASVAGLWGNVNLVDYCASKFGIVGLMTALQEELHILRKDHPIQFTTICPITINTGLAHHPKTRFPKLLPILDVHETSDYIVDKVLRNQNFVCIPRRIHILYILKQIFPSNVLRVFQQFSGYHNAPHLSAN